MHYTIRVLAVGLAMRAAMLGAAADEVSQRTVNDPGAFWGIWGTAKASYVAAPNLKGGAAQRVTISPKPNNAWDAGTYATITKPVKKDDVLVVMFWARAEKPPAGSDLIMVTGRINESGPSSNPVSPETSFLIGKQWKFYYTIGTATKDYPAGALSAGMLLGTGEQVIDFGPVSVIDYGQTFDLSKLPRN
jgi:hypothetical protein